MLKNIRQLKSLVILFLVMLFLTSCASTNSTKQKQADIYFSAGTQSLMQKQYTDALKSLLKANELTPNRSEILNNLGMAYYFKGEHEMATQTLTRALELDNENSDAKVNLASIHYKAGNIQKAEALYREVMRDLTYDKQARNYYNLGVLEIQHKRDLVAAESFFKKSIKEDDNYCPSYYQLGLIQFKRRQFNTALRNFKEATMGTCYDAPAPHYYQALSMIELRRFEDARIKLDEIDTRFKQTVFAVKARSKAIELNEIENRSKSNETHASRMVLESPDF